MLALEKRLVALRAEPIVTRTGRPIDIAFSAGVVEVGADETDEEAIHRADELLRQAKNEGGDQVVSDRGGSDGRIERPAPKSKKRRFRIESA